MAGTAWARAGARQGSLELVAVEGPGDPIDVPARLERTLIEGLAGMGQLETGGHLMAVGGADGGHHCFKQLGVHH